MKHIMLFKEWLTEHSQPLLLEGGAAGHMLHPYDDYDLTFGDFKKIIDAALQGELNFEQQPTEKTDGQNLWVTIKDDTVMFARNKTESIYPMNLSDIKKKFANHPSEAVRDTFYFASEDLSKLLSRLNTKKALEIFEDGKNFINMEIIYSKNSNIINYDKDVIQFHNVVETDGNGNIISFNSNPAREIVKVLERLESHIGKIFTVIPPRIIKLRKDIDFSKNKDKFLKRLDKLQREYKLNDADPLIKYHEYWWRDFIESEYPNLSDDIKHGLVLRWAYGDKKALSWRSLSKLTGDADISEIIKRFDKKDLKAKQKENIKPFENLFLELGSVVLKNASNLLAANPKQETERLRDYIQKKSKDILKSTDENSIEKVYKELERLNDIGGINSIFPTEGIVFKYNNKLYKLTGTFAAINQLLGIIKYGR